MAQHSSLGDFGKHIQGRAAKLEDETARLLKETVLAVVTDLAQSTPIKTGQAQANWLTNIGAPFPYYMANEDANNAAQDSIDFARRALVGVKFDSEIHITNNLPYISQLNAGSSKQAPALFVQAAVLRASYYQIQAFKISWA